MITLILNVGLYIMVFMIHTLSGSEFVLITFSFLIVCGLPESNFSDQEAIHRSLFWRYFALTFLSVGCSACQSLMALRVSFEVDSLQFYFLAFVVYFVLDPNYLSSPCFGHIFRSIYVCKYGLSVVQSMPKATIKLRQIAHTNCRDSIRCLLHTGNHRYYDIKSVVAPT